MYKEYVMTDKDISKFIKNIPLLSYNGDKEIFKQLVLDNFHSQYLVSTYGRIISTEYRGVPGRIAVLKQKIDTRGYYSIMLIINGQRRDLQIHRLVGITFIENDDPEHRIQINHIDGNKLNPHISNLEWCTPKENIHHIYKTGLKKHILKGEEITDSIYKEFQIRKVCELLEQGDLALSTISCLTDVSVGMIRHILNHHSWKHISCEYDIDNYKRTHEKYYNEKIPVIQKVCELLESGKYNIVKISEYTGISINIISRILKGEIHTKISKKYNISNYYKKRNKKERK